MTDWEKRARELLGPDVVLSEGTVHANIPAALRLAKEMSDKRAEEIARKCEKEADETLTLGGSHTAQGLLLAAQIARSFIFKKRTRAEVLEEALLSIKPCKCTHPDGCAYHYQARDECHHFKAARALEWKEGDR